MNKDDLKAGMMVEYRNGDKRMVMSYGLVDKVGIVMIELSFYTKDLLDVDGYVEHDIMKIYDYSTDGFDFECTYRKLLWERNEKPKLTKAERTILENIDKKLQYIVRDKNGELYVYGSLPKRDRFQWWATSGTTMSFCAFNHLFTFITWEDDEPYSIKELLGDE